MSVQLLAESGSCGERCLVTASVLFILIFVWLLDLLI